MKKLAKLLTLTCTLLMLFTFCFAGCDLIGAGRGQYKQSTTLNDKTTQEVYTDIVNVLDENKTNFSSEISYNVNCDISTSIGNQEQEVSIQMEMLDIFKINGTNFYEKTYIDLGNSIPGVPSIEVSEYWFVDDMAYLNVGGYKYKMAMTLNELLQTTGLNMDELINPLYDFSSTSFDKVKFNINRKDASDIYFELVLSGEEAETFANKKLGSLTALSGAQMDFGDISYKFIIDEEGQLSHSEINFEVNMSMDVSGMSATYKYSFDGEIRFSDLGTTVITPPADAESYI